MKHDAHTFKHAGYTAQAHSAAPGEFALNVWWTNEDSAGHQAILPASDAPAVALAILEAAGLPDADDDWLGEAVNGLRKHIQIRDKRAAEAKEQAELESEALFFFNAFWEGRDALPIESWDKEPGNAKQSWLAVARKAREMRAEK